METDQVPVLTDRVDLSSTTQVIESAPTEQPSHAASEWQPIVEKIWFVKNLQVLGPKSTAKVFGLHDRLSPDKTIWLEGKLQLSEITRLGVDRAKLLSIGRALSVKKALVEAGVEAQIRIKHPRLMATGRYVVLEQA